MKQLLVTKRNGNLEAINIDRIHKVLSHAADALGFDASEDDLESSYLDYAIRVIVGRSPSDPKVNVGKIEIQNYIFFCLIKVLLEFLSSRQKMHPKISRFVMHCFPLLQSNYSKLREG